MSMNAARMQNDVWCSLEARQCMPRARLLDTIKLDHMDSARITFVRGRYRDIAFSRSHANGHTRPYTFLLKEDAEN